MRRVADVLVLVVALEHLWFLVLEMFLWKTPLGLRAFRQSEERAKATATLAANQGLYNGFLASGLVWALLSGPDQVVPRASFFLLCVVAAGAYGSATVGRSILYVQAFPARAALVALWMSR
jgi:putative membrane protein